MRWAYLMVFKVWSAWEYPGFTQAIMPTQIFPEPMKESLRTMVSFEALKGTCWLLSTETGLRALMHAFRARRDLLIWAPASLRSRLFDLMS